MFKCNHCGSSNSTNIVSTDLQVIFYCADCDYVTCLDHVHEIVEIETCPSCGYEGVYNEGVEENTMIKICPSCKHCYAVAFDE